MKKPKFRYGDKPCVKCGAVFPEVCKAADERCPGLPSWLVPKKERKRATPTVGTSR